MNELTVQLPTPTPHLLIVDDDDVDREAMVRSLRRGELPNHISIATDGRHALAMLRGTSGDGIAAPRVVILDWKMPGMGGHECLRLIRADPGLASTVVFIVTSSDDPVDIGTAYSHNVAGYVVKSDGLSGLADLVRTYNDYIRLPD